MEKIIEIKNVCKVFGKRTKQVRALDNVSFDIYKGQNISLVGANGAGKTTLVEILAQLNKPTSGQIIYHLDTNKPISEQIGVQFQDSQYPSGISVKGIIRFIIDAYNSDITKEELEKLLDIFGVRSFYKLNARSLSGGQSQRLNILLALLHKPKVLFLDELSTGLDITIRNEIKAFIKQYAIDNGIQLLLVSHDMGEVEYLADRIIIMQKGKVIDDKLIKDIKKSKKTLEEYVVKYITH